MSGTRSNEPPAPPTPCNIIAWFIAQPAATRSRLAPSFAKLAAPGTGRSESEITEILSEGTDEEIPKLLRASGDRLLASHIDLSIALGGLPTEGTDEEIRKLLQPPVERLFASRIDLGGRALGEPSDSKEGSEPRASGTGLTGEFLQLRDFEIRESRSSMGGSSPIGLSGDHYFEGPRAYSSRGSTRSGSGGCLLPTALTLPALLGLVAACFR